MSPSTVLGRRSCEIWLSSAVEGASEGYIRALQLILADDSESQCDQGTSKIPRREARLSF